MDVYEIRTNTKELLYKGDDYTLAVQSYYDFQEESENDIESKLFGLEVIGYINGRKDEYLYKKGGKLTGGPLYKKGDAVSNKDIIYRVVSVLRDEDNHFHYRISYDQTDMVIIKESELKSARENHQYQISKSENNLKKLFIIDEFAMTEASAMRESDIYEQDKKAKIYIKELSDFISRNNYPGRMSMSIYKEIESSGNHLLNNALSLLGKFGPEMRNTYKDAYSESKNMYINPTVVKSGNNEKTYKQKIAVLEMLKKDMEKDLSATPKDLLKMEIKIEMLKEKSSEKFSKGGVLGYKLDINKILLNDKDRAIEIEQDSLLRGIDVRRSGKIVVVRDFDKIDDVIKLLKYNLSFAYPQTKLSFAKGGELTYKQKYNKKYDYPKNEGHSLTEISKDTGVSKKGLQKIYNKGVGAYKTNPQSVRPSVKSPEQWAQARVYSSVMGGKAAKVDAKELKMEKGGMTEKVSAIKKMMAKGGEIEREIYYRIENNYIGWLELGSYTTNRGVPNVSLKFTQAMNNLFDYLKSEDGIYSSKEYSKSKYAIVKYDTSKKKRGGYTELDGYAELKENVVFKISAKEVIKMKDEFSFKKGGEVDKHDTKQYYEISFTFEDEAEQSIGGYASNEQEAKELAKKWVNDRGYTNLMNVEAEVVEPPMDYDDDEWQLKEEQPFPYYEKGGRVYRHKHIPTMTFEITGETSKGYKGIQKDKKSLSKLERVKGKKVSYSSSELKDLFKKDYEKGGEVNEAYVDFMNKKKGFRPDRKYFKTYEEAEKWARKEFDRFNSDMIGYTEFERPLMGYAKGGALSKEFKFDKNFVVYVPSTSDVSDKISRKELDSRVNEVKEYVANTFGGYTETETEGGYKSSKGDIVEEDVVKVSVFSKNKDWKDKEYEVVKKAKQWAREWGQEAIGFEYEGDLYYIDGDGKMEKGGLTASKKRIKKSWGGTIDMPRGSGWGDYKKGKRVLKIKELEEGGRYLAYSKQFDAKNIVYIIPEGKTDINPPGSSMFTDKKLFIYIKPTKKIEQRNEMEMPMKIGEDQLQDNYANYDFFKIKGYKYSKGGSLTQTKAKQILKDGEANGKDLTEKQKRYFGAIAGGGKSYAEGGEITVENEDERTTLSLNGIGSIVITETTPEYEFVDDISADELENLDLDEYNFISKIEDLRINDGYKGKGYAKLLMNKALDYIDENYSYPIYLNASPMQSDGMLNLNDLTAFYEKFGFKVFKREGNNNLMIKKSKYGVGGFLTGAVLGAVGGAYVNNKINKKTKKREAEGKKAKAPEYLYTHPLWDNTIYKYLKKKKISNKEIDKLWDKGLQNIPKYLKKRKKLKQSIK